MPGTTRNHKDRDGSTTEREVETKADGASASSVPRSRTAKGSSSSSSPSPGPCELPSVTLSVFLYWVLPVLVIACSTRFLVDPGAAAGLGLGGGSPPVVPAPPTGSPEAASPLPSPLPAPPSSLPTVPSLSPSSVEKPKRKQTPVPTLVAEKPTAYADAVRAIARRRLDWSNVDSNPMEGYPSGPERKAGSGSGSGPGAGGGGSSNKNTDNSGARTRSCRGGGDAKPPPAGSRGVPRGASMDPVRIKLVEKIDALRARHEEDPSNLFDLIHLADALRLYDVQYHDGGSFQEEAIDRYKAAISLAMATRQAKLDRGEDTRSPNVQGEMVLDYEARSIDSILCALHTSLGKVYFMSNMFERAVESYTEALGIEPMYLEAIAARGSSRIILGKYREAGRDLTTVMERDESGMFLDVYTGLARILQAREDAVPTGWGPIVERLQRMIPLLEEQHASLHDHQRKGRQNNIAHGLNRLFHVLFMYHDTKTKDTDAAWENLTKSYHYKMGALPPWNAGFENQKISATKQIFSRSFFPDGVGSQSEVPIFIIGFVRSGSTLLERVLDAHPQIVGTGENSVFNGRLDEIRNKIVETSLSGDTNQLKRVIASLADGVVDEMRERWKMVSAGTTGGAGPEEEETPLRFTDKMLTNYYNVGFIHMLFPNALILHVIREPMDTIFSAYKHEFPAGTLDYTSDFPSLAELYHGYRDLMDHWDRELPGRVTHVRYEDMVHDMPGVARRIVAATGLEWDDSILDFHKKKHAVNTLSTTQVRRGVYKDSLKSWKRYEKHLGPLLELIGERTSCGIETTLPGYEKPPVEHAASGDGDPGGAPVAGGTGAAPSEGEL
ncbi:unnamed protein product [Pseudo-nitzschia multistriata]|uniref:protein-tyrosine sulfotransferase n=1 Tax=Pseudo-nitzschia multistriata TaxID=183589 RepID=A0A448ZEG2_9STRA|nr:unnamed protein product [Pseudo-nitzschia multistriata]